LAEADLARLDRALAQRGGSGLRPVGFFRSHTRKGLSLNSEDLAVMESHFHEAHQFALVVRPFAAKASTAGIFIREHGVLEGEKSCLEFPFRSAQLAPSRHLADIVEPPPLNAPAPPLAPKPVQRAQIVPIASRRDITPIVPPLVTGEPIPVLAVAPPRRIQPKPEAEPDLPLEAAIHAKIEPPAEARPELKMEAKTEARVEAKPEPKPAATVQPKIEAKVEAKPAAKVEPKAEVKVEPKPVAKVEPKMEAKVEPKPAAQVEPKAEVKVEPKPAAKVEAKSEGKIEPHAEAQPAAIVEIEPLPKAALEDGADNQAEESSSALEIATVVTPPARARKGGRLIWFAVGAIFPLLLSGVLFIYPGVFHRGSQSGPLSRQDSSPLALRVERTGGELLLNWNRDSDVIRNASHAVLSIADGPQHENVEMDLAQLRNGSIVYSPVTADVVFRMEVSGKDNAKITSESVRVLRTRPSPMDDGQPGKPSPTGTIPAANGTGNGAPNGGANGANNGANNGAINGAASGPAAKPALTNPALPGEIPGALPPNAAAPPDQPQPSAAPASLKPFNTATLSERLRPARSGDEALPAEPNVGRAEVLASPSGLGFNGVAPNALPTAPKRPEPVAPAAAAAAPMATGGNIQTAQLIVRKQPEYPKLARDAGAKGNVELIATIGSNGKVKSVKVVKGHPLLQRAAVEAVMQWQYKPTILNGVAVETTSNIVLNFVNEH